MISRYHEPKHKYDESYGEITKILITAGSSSNRPVYMFVYNTARTSFGNVQNLRINDEIAISRYPFKDEPEIRKIAGFCNWHQSREYCWLFANPGERQGACEYMLDDRGIRIEKVVKKVVKKKTKKIIKKKKPVKKKSKKSNKGRTKKSKIN